MPLLGARFWPRDVQDRAARAASSRPGLRQGSTSEPLTVGVIGTWIYMAPEQIDPSADRPIDARTDVYALGATLYELMTLRRAVDSH